MQGNSQLAQYILCRFQANYPMLLQLFSQAWQRGDAAGVHAIGARMASHLRVLGLDEAVLTLQDLLAQQGEVTALHEKGAWQQIQFEAVCSKG